MKEREYKPKRLFAYGTLKDTTIAREAGYFPEFIITNLKLAKPHLALANGILIAPKYEDGIGVPTYLPGVGIIRGILYDFSSLDNKTWKKFLNILDRNETGYIRAKILVTIPSLKKTIPAWTYKARHYKVLEYGEWNPREWYRYKYLFPGKRG